MRQIIKTVVKFIFKKIGFDIMLLPKQNKNTTLLEVTPVDYDDCKSEYFIEDEALIEIKKIRPFTMQNEGRLITLYQQAVYCEKNNIKGSFIECGVWKGGAVGLMALANLKYGKSRRDLHLFDCFQDACEPDELKDGQRVLDEIKKHGGSEAKSQGNLKPNEGIYDFLGGHGTVEGNKELIENVIGYDAKHVNYHKGYFQDTLPIVAPQINEIAILRLDGDFYYSIKVCLDHLYSKVVSGGFIIIDDYFYYKGCTEAVDDFLRENNINVYLHHADYASKYHAYWIKP